MRDELFDEDVEGDFLREPDFLADAAL